MVGFCTIKPADRHVLSRSEAHNSFSKGAWTVGLQRTIDDSVGNFQFHSVGEAAHGAA